jgi:hypothetical protein
MRPHEPCLRMMALAIEHGRFRSGAQAKSAAYPEKAGISGFGATVATRCPVLAVSGSSESDFADGNDTVGSRVTFRRDVHGNRHG